MYYASGVRIGQTGRSYWLCVLLSVSTASPVGSVLAQSPADGPWVGSIQCQVDEEQQGYSRHEVQTWRLTSSTPTSKNGAMQIYPATWTVSGKGSARQESRKSSAQWAVAVPPTSAPIAMFVRASDGKFIIRLWHSLSKQPNGLTGERAVAANGVQQQLSSINSAVPEWPLPWIETMADANIAGSLSVPIEGLGADLAALGQPSAAMCTWQFSRATSSSLASAAGQTQMPSTQTTPGAAGAGQAPNQAATKLPTRAPLQGNSASACPDLGTEIEQAYQQAVQKIELAYNKPIGDDRDHIAQLDAEIAQKESLLASSCSPGPQLVSCMVTHTRSLTPISKN